MEELHGKRSFGRTERRSVEKHSAGKADELVKEVGSQHDHRLTDLFVLLHQDPEQHWLAENPQRHDFHFYLERAYHQIHADFDTLAERLTALGGLPSSGPAA